MSQKISLTEEEYSRYGRQMQVPVFNSLKGQLNMKNSSLLVIGCGGLGSSALLYLAASGVGCIGLLDFDRVEVSNLHRQIIHDTSTVGMYKTESAALKMKALNPHLKINVHSIPINNLNSTEVCKDYDLILDCTDSPTTKYLISDTCVVLNKPLISASALKTDGQLNILNFQGGPCYRCLHPIPTKPENVATCSDSGVIGPCVGLVGVLMSIEAIKILTDFYNVKTNPYKPVMLMYSGYMDNNGQIMKSFKMRGKQSSCICSTMTAETIQNTDYEQFCGKIEYNVLDEKYRISFDDLANHQDSLIVDVRPSEQYHITNLSIFNEELNVVNIPIKDLMRLDEDSLSSQIPLDKPVLLLCKRGNDSRLAAKYLLGKGYTALDLRGGLNEYAKTNEMDVYW